MRFRRRVKYCEQHLEDPHTDNEQDGERQPAHGARRNDDRDDYAYGESDHVGTVRVANDPGNDHGTVNLADDSNHEDQGRDRHGRLRHDDNDRDL